MSAPVKLAAVFSGIRSRKDRTFSLTFDTQELAGQDAAQLMELQQSFCALLIAPTAQDLDGVEIPDYKPLEGQTKTPAQRQRATLFVFWSQHGGEQILGDFDSFYSRMIEKYIASIKAKLDGEAGP